jgi:predicted PurR-regulated permease PerM
VSLAFIGVLWLLKPIQLPFVAGAVIAYFLDPLVKKLVARRVPRALGAGLVLLGFVLVVVAGLVLLLPLIQSQISSLIAALPSYAEAARAALLPHIAGVMEKLSPHDVEKLRDAAGGYAGNVALWIGDVLKKIVSGGLAIFDVATLLVVTPVVAFFLLRDWPGVTEKADSLVPRKNHGLFRQAVEEIDRTLSGFLRGQALVCLSLGLIYGVGLTLAGLKYGATIGIIAGFLSFIPYVGSTFVLVSSTILALMQFNEAMPILKVFSVFLVGQALEGYVLTPKLVGDRVGLHPVWILFAIFAGASLMGFVGVLIAVPVASIIGVLIRLGLRHYMKSPLYERRRTPR